MFQTWRDPAAPIRPGTRRPAAKLEIFLLYPGVHAVIFHRVSHWLYRHKLFFLARLNSQIARHAHRHRDPPRGQDRPPASSSTTAWASSSARPPRSGTTACIYHGVTLGGTGKDQGKRHPTLGNNVMVSAGAKVLGPFKVGDGARIAANAVVLTEIPPEATAVGVPARVVRIAGEKVDYASTVDQIHVTDPVQKELQALSSRLEWLEKFMDEQAKRKI